MRRSPRNPWTLAVGRARKVLLTDSRFTVTPLVKFGVSDSVKHHWDSGNDAGAITGRRNQGRWNYWGSL